MKIAIVSDIHCNIAALDRALAALDHVDELFCAGDSVYGYRWSNDVVTRLRARGAHMVLGNHDADFLKIHRERKGSNGHITPENHRWMLDLNHEYEIDLDGRRILMVHASPFEPYHEYIYPHSPRFREFGKLEADLFLYGHTHRAVAQRVGRVLVVNPGSAGESRDSSRQVLTYAVVDLTSMEAEIHEIDPAMPLD
ncbi:MAG: metallophosphoesterase family protein [Chloroflexota bacterium]